MSVYLVVLAVLVLLVAVCFWLLEQPTYDDLDDYNVNKYGDD